MVWCPMITAQAVIVRHVTGRTWSEHERTQLLRYFASARTPEGVWGLHPESGGYVFVSTLCHVALRLLGLPAEDPLVQPAGMWLRSQPGGVLTIPTWGKFWLALLGLYDWRGVSPLPPELFSLPTWLPFHPRRWYCHTRYVYLAMSWLYGQRFVADLGPLREELCHELYGTAFESIPFARHANSLAATDTVQRPLWLLRWANTFLRIYEWRPLAGLRRQRMQASLGQILNEQQVSADQTVSPVNGLLNCLVLFASGDQAACDRALAGMEHWRWEDATGLRYVGSRSQTWDTSFAMEAVLAAYPQANHDKVRQEQSLASAAIFLQQAQQTNELSDEQRSDREISRGGWCFTEGRHRWPVSDCTAEALNVLLALYVGFPGTLRIPEAETLPLERFEQAVLFILSRQNSDGGFGSYERQRGPRWLEWFNPAEMYKNCMIEHSYVECTASSLVALSHFRRAFPDAPAFVTEAVQAGVKFLRKNQRPDGSFPGFWGIQFTYGIFHAVRGLLATGAAPNDLALQRAGQWLLKHQRADGGWGEHWTGCVTGEYVEHPISQVVMTSWALLSLMEIDLETETDETVRIEAVSRGVAWLEKQQQTDGSWPQPGVNGVFFGTAMLDYRLYRSYFPVWALARYAVLHPQAARQPVKGEGPS